MSGSEKRKAARRSSSSKRSVISQMSILANISALRNGKSFPKLLSKKSPLDPPSNKPANGKQNPDVQAAEQQQEPKKDGKDLVTSLNVTNMSDVNGVVKKGKKKESRKVLDPKEREKLKEDKRKLEEERRVKKKELLLGLVKVGQVVEDSQEPKNRFEIVEQLGIGGFGIVHLVKNIAKPDAPQYAMKLEPNATSPKDLETLKYEASIMVMLEQLEPQLKTHFVKCISRGQSPNFKFVVMDLLGQSIYDIKKTVINSFGFTIATSLKIAIQSCEAIRDFHAGGFLHRDIKVQNFAVGKANESIIYLIDFGIAKRFMELKHDKLLQIKYREKVHFFGTLKLCARAAHDGIEQSPKDDLESWLYMCLDLCKGGVLPWSKGKGHEEINKGKKEFFAQRDRAIFDQVPNAFEAITLYIDNLVYNDTPDYKFVINVLEMDAKELLIDLKQDFDWIADNGNRKHTTNVTVIKDVPDDVAEFNENDERVASNKDNVDDPEHNKAAHPLTMEMLDNNPVSSARSNSVKSSKKTDNEASIKVKDAGETKDVENASSIKPSTRKVEVDVSTKTRSKDPVTKDQDNLQLVTAKRVNKVKVTKEEASGKERRKASEKPEEDVNASGKERKKASDKPEDEANGKGMKKTSCNGEADGSGKEPKRFSEKPEVEPNGKERKKSTTCKATEDASGKEKKEKKVAA